MAAKKKNHAAGIAMLFDLRGSYPTLRLGRGGSIYLS